MTRIPGKVQTVLGPLGPENLGIVVPHEHLLVDLTPLYRDPLTASDRARALRPVVMEDLNWHRFNRLSNWDNGLLGNEDTAIAEALIFKESGGKTIVDCTSIGIGRDPLGLARISRATGLNIIMGAGYYIAETHPKDMDSNTESDIAKEMVRDLTVGVGDTVIKSGVIGELGCSSPLHPHERKVLRAAAKAQQETGAPISIHPGHHDSAPLEIIEILAEAGADPLHIIMGHIERTVTQSSTLKKLATSGCFLEYDLFGRDYPYYPFAPHIAMPTDAQRLRQLAGLIAEGHVAQLLLSQDVCRKTDMVRYGGFGYAHILEIIVPWMRRRGFKEEHIQAMLIENPARALTFV